MCNVFGSGSNAPKFYNSVIVIRGYFTVIVAYSVFDTEYR